jgi:hypothetical protein
MGLPEPYYDRDGVTIYCGDAREILPEISADVMVTDPPYGIEYRSSMTGHHGGTALPGIAGDNDTALRDFAIEQTRCPAIVFGSWKVAKPDGCRMVLTWDKGDHVGMGDLSLPWKPNTEEIYVLGSGFIGHRGTAVLHFPAPVTWNSVAGGRQHPHEKPIPLMRELIKKCPPGVIVDPFIGSGATLRAAMDLGRKVIGIEIEERYCEIAVKRLAQSVLPLFAALA